MDVRVVEWAEVETDVDGKPRTRYFYRIEQLTSGHWVPVDVYRLQKDGSLQSWPAPQPDMKKVL